MRSMFYNYDNNINKDLSQRPCLGPVLPAVKEGSPNLSFIYNIKGDALGVCAKHLMPFMLYFHLEEIHGWPLDSYIADHMIEFKVCTTTGKDVFRKTLAPSECFNSLTNDLAIEITQAEAELLKQETYTISVKLLCATGFYTLFSANDGILMIR